MYHPGAERLRRAMPQCMLFERQSAARPAAALARCSRFLLILRHIMIVHCKPPYRLWCLVAALAAAHSVFAQPEALRAAAQRPVRIVVPSMGGGIADSVARIVAARLQENSRSAYQVENRPGDESHFGAEVVAKAEPDGSIVLFAPITLYAAAVSLYARLHYAFESDFTPVTLIANAPHLLATHPSLPVRSVKDLVALAHANPDRIRWASHGRNSLSQLELEMFKSLSGIKVSSVPYGNTARVLPELLAGNADLVFDSIAAVLPHVKTGRLRGIAVAGGRRSPALREVPTVAEAGVAGFEADHWYGLLAPEGTGKAIVDRLNEDFAKAVNATEVRERLLQYGIEARSSGPADLAKTVRGEVAKWEKVVKTAARP